MENKSVFDVLNEINVNSHTEEKNGLTYLTWAWAWAEFKKVYPEATYSIKKFGISNLPYVYDENTGYMVFTSVTVECLTHEMWLPVMDGANKAMKNKPYEYKTKWGTKTCEAATMFDVNKTIMRCLVKNLAMFGLGLYIYAGEDLPESTDTSDDVEKVDLDKLFPNVKAKAEEVISTEKANALKQSIKNNKLTDMTVQAILGGYGYTSIEEIKLSDYMQVVSDLKGAK